MLVNLFIIKLFNHVLVSNKNVRELQNATKSIATELVKPSLQKNQGLLLNITIIILTVLFEKLFILLVLADTLLCMGGRIWQRLSNQEARQNSWDY